MWNWYNSSQSSPPARNNGTKQISYSIKRAWNWRQNYPCRFNVLTTEGKNSKSIYQRSTNESRPLDMAFFQVFVKELVDNFQDSQQTGLTGGLWFKSCENISKLLDNLETRSIIAFSDNREIGHRNFTSRQSLIVTALYILTEQMCSQQRAKTCYSCDAICLNYNMCAIVNRREARVKVKGWA